MRFKDDRGSYTIEALFIFPLLLVFFVLTFWFGTLMYTWSTVNYASMQYALDIAKEGQKTGDITNAVKVKLGNVPIKDVTKFSEHSSPYNDPNSIVIWTNGNSFNRGDVITAGVVYPVKVPSPLLSILGKAAFGSDTIFLKAHATAKSEVYFEP